jgi:murein DD-endopeptidase MepM/ murein hydrolase activator NlpD
LKLLVCPIKGFPLSKIKGGAKYGMRKHPTLGVMRMHWGVDMSIASGTPILSADDGTVYISKFGSGYGNYVVVRHRTYYNLYAHMSKRSVVAGQKVKAGGVLGSVGSTGESSGPHLHFGVCIDYNRMDKGWMDPLPLLEKIGEDDEVIIKQKIQINGVIKEVEAINKEGYNFIKLRDLEDAIEVGYDESKKLPIVNSK